MTLGQSLVRLIPGRILCRMDIRVRTRVGRELLNIPIRYEGLAHLSWKRTWMAHVIERLVGVEAGVFVDVGANVGQTLLDLQATHPGIGYVGIEPNPRCVAYLHDLIAANRWSHCTIVPIALASEAGLLRLYCHTGYQADDRATILSHLRPGREYDVSYVPCFPFDAISDSLSNRAVGLVKIDVEGAELDVILGMRSYLLAHRPIIVCEVLFTDSKAAPAIKSERNARLMDCLTGLNYTVWQLIKSADRSTVIRAERVLKFQSAVSCEENKDLCDYLFLSAEAESRTLDLLFGNVRADLDKVEKLENKSRE